MSVRPYSKGLVNDLKIERVDLFVASGIGQDSLSWLNRLDGYYTRTSVRLQVPKASESGDVVCHLSPMVVKNGGSIEDAYAVTAHASPRPTKLYDRRSDEINLAEIKRIMIQWLP